MVDKPTVIKPFQRLDLILAGPDCVLFKNLSD